MFINIQSNFQISTITLPIQPIESFDKFKKNSTI